MNKVFTPLVAITALLALLIGFVTIFLVAGRSDTCPAVTFIPEQITATPSATVTATNTPSPTTARRVVTVTPEVTR